MKSSKAMLSAIALIMGFGISAPAFAWGHHGGRVHFGVVVGGPLWWGPPYPYYYPPYYYPPVYYSLPPSPPPVYVEQGAPQAAPQPPAYWYYCAEAKGYYPYVKDCPGGWQRVPAEPPR